MSGAQDITNPEEAVEGLEPGTLTKYKLFSSTLSSGLVEPPSATPLTKPGAPLQATERTPYLRNDSTCVKTRAPATCRCCRPPGCSPA